MAKIGLSAYDNPDPMPGDPMPVEGVEPLTPEQLAHFRIQEDLKVLKATQLELDTQHRTAFNNMAGNTRRILTEMDQALKLAMRRIQVLESVVTKKKIKP